MSVVTHPQAEAALHRRLWLYQAERFPLARTATLLAVFSAASLAVSAQLADRPLPPFWSFVAMWGTSLVLFFQMRACDEWKDLEDDRRFRPERPVPSGLVSLRLVVWLAVAAGVAALALTASVAPGLVILLALVWLWLGLMTVEFGAPEWLKRRPLLYLVSHMAIMPLIDLLMTGGEWWPHGAPPGGLWLFLALSFVNGCVLEVGRKVWAPESEREGVETYSALLGPRRAALAWMVLCVVSFALLLGVGLALDAPLLVGGLGLAALLGALAVGTYFRAAPDAARERALDATAGLWVFACYAIAGFAPLLRGVLP